MASTLDIAHDEGVDPLPEDVCATLDHLAAQVARAHALPTAIRLVLIDDEYMGHLNATYRNKTATTDVLSFDLGSTPGQPSSGEIYISLDQSRRQAMALDVPPLEELARLLVHGLLHLAGWVHDTPAQLEAMERETEVFLDAIPL
jgi:rRNA maturation RNase YbeY